MAFWDGLLGGGASSDPLDIYGDLFTKEQKAALQQRSMGEGLLRMAGAFGAAAQPSRMPTSFMGALGQAAGAMAGHGDETANTALKGMEMAEKVRQSRQERAILAKAAPLVEAIASRLIRNGVPAAQAAQIASQVAGGQTTSATPTNMPPGSPPPGSGYPGPTNEELGAPPVSMGLPAAGVSPFGLPDAPGTAPAAPPLPPTVAPRQQNTGLLPPQDQMVGPDGQPLQGPGILPTMNASYGGTPGGMPPFRLASSTPTGGATPGAAGRDPPGGDPWIMQNKVGFPTLTNPDTSPVQWTTNPQLEVPLGQDPGDVLPSGKRLSPQQNAPFPGSGPPAAAGRDDPRGVVPYIRERARALGIDPDVAERVARSEGVGSFQSSATQSSGRREPSYGAFQLYTGGGMGNDFHRDTGLDPADPRNEKATIDYALEKARTGGWTPFHGAKGAGISARAGIPGGEDYVIPSGRGIPASALRNVADTGEAPGAPAGSGVIPGLGVTPEALGALNAMLKMGGLKSDPFGSLLETYYKSPGYLGQKAKTEAQAQKDVALEMDPKIEAGKAAATQKYIQENETHKSSLDLARDLIGKGVYLDKATGTMKPITNAAQAMAEISRVQEQNKVDIGLVDTTLTFPGESQPRKVQMTGAQARAIAEGREVQVGGVTIPAMTGIKLGQPVPSEEDKAGIQARGAAQTEMYKAGQKALDTAHDAVRGANQRAPYYGSMLAATEGFKPGATAEMRLAASQYLRDLGVIKGDNVPQGEQLKLAGERLAFLAVPPNQGSWSNIERQSLKSSIPGMATTAEGLAEAIKLMQQLDDYDRKVSTIHRQVADKNGGLPNLLEAQRQVEALGPPLSAQQEAALERLRQPPAGAAPGGGANATKPANEIIQNGWRYDATTHKPIGPVQ